MELDCESFYTVGILREEFYTVCFTMAYTVSRLVASSLVLSTLFMVPALKAQAFPYRFCTDETVTPPQELTDAIADFLNSHYQGGVKLVSPICSGPNPRMNNQETWVYQAEFSGGQVLDVAVIEGSQGRRISVQDDRRRDSDGSGWTRWQQLD